MADQLLPARTVELVTQPTMPPPPGMTVPLLGAAFAAAGMIGLIAWMLMIRKARDAAEPGRAAFDTLSRRLRLSKAQQREILEAGVRSGVAPVALLICRGSPGAGVRVTGA